MQTYHMNACDEDAEIAGQEEAQRMLLLIEAGVTAPEYWAYMELTSREAVN